MSIFNTGKSLIKKVKVVPVFLTINDEYAPYAACAIRSLTQHTDPNRFYRVIILYDKLAFGNRVKIRNLVTKNCEIQFRKLKNSLALRAIIKHCASKTGSGDFFSSAVYFYRSFISRLFPQYDKAIYIDSDVILLDDIGELFDINLEDNVIGACVDPKVSAVPEFRDYVEKAVGVPAEEYINSGVLLMDLKQLRKMHYLSTMIGIIEKYNASLVAPDQDYLNVILRGKIKHLPLAWNAAPSDNLPSDTKLVHFNLSEKPWFYHNVVGEDIFWSVAKVSGFINELLHRRENFTVNDKRMDRAKRESLIKKAEKLAKVKEPIIKSE